jgi:hypothetical protein
VEQVLDAFTTSMVFVQRLLNLPLELDRRDALEMMYVKAQVQPTHQSTEQSTFVEILIPHMISWPFISSAPNINGSNAIQHQQNQGKAKESGSKMQIKYIQQNPGTVAETVKNDP